MNSSTVTMAGVLQGKQRWCHGRRPRQQQAGLPCGQVDPKPTHRREVRHQRRRVGPSTMDEAEGILGEDVTRLVLQGATQGQPGKTSGTREELPTRELL